MANGIEVSGRYAGNGMIARPIERSRSQPAGQCGEIDLDIKSLKKRWAELLQPYGNEKAIDTGFDELVEHYSEPHRHYHNLHHVNGCLAEFRQIAQLLKDPFAIEAAIWFHDVIYDPKSSKNEARSAEYAQTFLASTTMTPNTISGIVHLIRLTQHPSSPKTEDEKYLIDIDLSTLGAEPAQYDRYEIWIREEYAYVPGFLYKKGRRKLLEAFLSCEHIYRTPYFRKRLETRARENINRALENL